MVKAEHYFSSTFLKCPSIECIEGKLSAFNALNLLISCK